LFLSIFDCKKCEVNGEPCLLFTIHDSLFTGFVGLAATAFAAVFRARRQYAFVFIARGVATFGFAAVGAGTPFDDGVFFCFFLISSHVNGYNESFALPIS
jgi:hypothetical protein